MNQKKFDLSDIFELMGHQLNNIFESSFFFIKFSYFCLLLGKLVKSFSPQVKKEIFISTININVLRNLKIKNNMKKILILMISWLGVMQAQIDTFYTEKPWHPCQENTCKNSSTLVLEAQNNSAQLGFIAYPFDAILTSENISHTLIERYSLDDSSSDFEWVSAITDLNTQQIQSAWSAIESESGYVYNPIYALYNFSSVQCGEWANRTAIQLNRARTSINLDPLLIQRLAMNGHVVLQYYDNDHGKWVYWDADAGSTSVAFVADGNGFYASIEEMVINPELILHEDTYISYINDGQDNICTKELFYNGSSELFSEYSFSEISDTIEDPSERIILPAGAKWELNDITGNYYYFDTVGLVDALRQFCPQDSVDLIVEAIQEDQGDDCGSDVFIECIFEALVTINGFPDLYNDFIPFLQSGTYHAFYMGEAPVYRQRYLRGGETTKLTLQPGEYSPDDLDFGPFLVKKIMPENTQTPFMISGETYDDTIIIEKHSEGDFHEDASVNIAVKGASIPEETGVVTIEFYFNYYMLPFMHDIQRIIIYEGEVDIQQEFQYNKPEEGTPLSLDVQDALLSLYPNPTHGTVNFSQPSSGDVYDIMGKKVLSFNEENSLNLPQASGMYFIHTTEGIHKVIKY